MSNDITLFSQVPAHLRDTELSETTKALMGNASNAKRISIKGGTFRLVVGGKELAQIEERNMDVIIVRAAPAVSRQWYEKAYDPEAGAVPPDCWSNDGEKPDATAKNRQAETCNKCPKNIAGSGQGNSRACRYQQRLAVMLADDMESGVYQLSLPATSIFGKAEGDKRPLKDYVTYLASQTKPVNVDTLVTKMRFDTKVEQPKLFFSPVRWLTDDQYVAARAAGDTPEAKQAVTMTVAQTDTAPIKVEGTRPDKSAADKAFDQPHHGHAEEETVKPIKTRKKAEAPTEVDEPEKRKAAPKAEESVPRKPSNLADVVAAWDDE